MNLTRCSHACDKSDFQVLFALNLNLLKLVDDRIDNLTTRKMRLTLLQKLLWAAAGLATMAYVAVAFLGDRQPATGSQSETAFRADFELTDHLGTFRQDEDFAGKWLLVFFGFTNCPDVCPTTLSEVAAVMEGLGEEATRVQPLFISIDPERDTPTALAEYVPLFDAGFIGLTGTPDQVARTAAKFYVYYEKITEAASPEDYTMSHTSQLFLFDPESEYVKVFAYGTSAEDILADLEGRLPE